MSTNSSAAVFESYVRTPDFEAIAADLELSPDLWDIFARTGQRVSAAAIAAQLGVTPEVALLGLRELAGHRLLRKHVQRWNEYRGATVESPRPPIPAAVQHVASPPPPASAPSPVSVPVAPPASSVPRAAEPSAPPPEARPAVRALPIAVGRQREVRFTCGPKAGRRRPPVEVPGTIRFKMNRSGVTCERRPAAQPHAEPADPAVTGGWRLRPLLDAIVRRGGGGVQGQLLAYRVFLRVPAELLDRAGLHSLNLVDDDFVVREPELYAAIRRSMREVAGFEDDTPAAPMACSLT